MARYYYGTVSALAWVLNHYFYGGVHYSWLAEEFHPLRTNPDSSNPYVLYGQLYAAWSWPDELDKVVAQLRTTLRRGVIAHARRGAVDMLLAQRLLSICKHTSVTFFYPVVYRVDVEGIPPERRLIAGSGEEGSHEFLVPDLGETEFELLFADNRADADFVRFFLDAPGPPTRTSTEAVLATLEERVSR